MRLISLNSPFISSTKMYRDLRENFWWSNLKGEIAEYVCGCDTCQRIKASHLKTAGQMQSLSIPTWKWDDISMDFIVGLPLTPQKNDSVVLQNLHMIMS
jgi:hypothetical protein